MLLPRISHLSLLAEIKLYLRNSLNLPNLPLEIQTSLILCAHNLTWHPSDFRRKTTITLNKESTICGKGPDFSVWCVPNVMQTILHSSFSEKSSLRRYDIPIPSVPIRVKTFKLISQECCLFTGLLGVSSMIHFSVQTKVGLPFSVDLIRHLINNSLPKYFSRHVRVSNLYHNKIILILEEKNLMNMFYLKYLNLSKLPDILSKISKIWFLPKLFKIIRKQKPNQNQIELKILSGS